MLASVFVLIIVAIALLLGFLLIAAGTYMATRPEGTHRNTWVLAGVLAGLLVNSWWIVLSMMVWFQTAILQQDP